MKSPEWLVAAALSAVFVTAAAEDPAQMPRFVEDQPVGFAAVAALGVEGTTGGGDVAPIVVRDALAFRDSVEKRDIKNKAQRESTPRVVLVVGDIDLGVLANERPGKVLQQVGIVQVRSNLTIVGATGGATLRRGTLEVHGGHNVIIRNLHFRDLWEEDPTGAYDALGWDFLRISNAGQVRSHHVWIDHCDFEKAYDGLLDITHGSDLVTISWCRFAGDARGPQKKAMLIGHSSGPTAASVDRGRLNVTLHHNWFVDIEDRAPRARFGNIHAFNNLVEGARYATISVCGAVTLVEHCVYRDVRIATSFSHANDNVLKDRSGEICLDDSLNLLPRPAPAPDDEAERFEAEHNFTGTVTRSELLFNPPADWTWDDRARLPYAYDPDAPEGVAAIVRGGAGVVTNPTVPSP
jgi:pectate lyase